MDPWHVSLELVSDLHYIYHFLLFRPWRAPSCIFCFGWMETNVNTHDVGPFCFLFWRSRIDDYFPADGYKFIWAAIMNQYNIYTHIF